MPGSSRPKRKPPAPNDATPRRAPLPTADDPPPTGRELDDRKHFLTYWQPVPPPITDDEAREYIERFDRLSIGRGPAESQLPTDEALTEEERWQRSQGWTPYELLTHAMHQPFLPFRDRIDRGAPGDGDRAGALARVVRRISQRARQRDERMCWRQRLNLSGVSHAF